MKLKRKISEVLIVTMIASLFAGTISAAPRDTGGGSLFKKDPIVLISEENQVAQGFDVASPANASLADGTLEASPAEAIASVEADADENKIFITPEASAVNLPDPTTIILQDGSNTYQGKVKFLRNYFKQGFVEIEADESLVVPFIASATGSDAAAAHCTAEPAGFVAIADQAGGIKITPEKITEDKIVTITLKDGATIKGICEVRITMSGETDTAEFLTDTIKSVKVNENVDLTLTDYAEAVMASPSEAKKVEVKSADEAIASVEKTESGITVTGKSKGSTSVDVTYPDKNGASKTNTCEIEVTSDEEPDDSPTGDFFEREGTLILVKGYVEKLPVKSEVWEAIRTNNGTLISSDKAVADVSDKSGDAICYVQGKKVGTATFRIELNGLWDEQTVKVIDGTKENLFKIEDKDKTVSVTAGWDAMIELTEKAQQLLEEEDPDTVEVIVADEGIASGTLMYSQDSSSDVIVVSGLSAGVTTMTLRIGDVLDTCTVKVTRNYVDEMESALESVKDIDESNAIEKKTTIVAAISAIGNITKDMVKDNPQALNELEDPAALEAQMDTIAKLEELLPIINPNIKLPGADVKEEIAALVGGIGFTGVGLSVDPETTTPTTAKMVVKSAKAEAPNVTLSANAVALDITLDISGQESQPKAPIRVTMGAPESLKDKDIAIYHVHNGKSAKIKPYMNGSQMTFYITELSTFVIDEDNVETVKVLLKSAEGGHVSAYSEDSSGVRTYVPIGEMVSIPVGTELHFDIDRFGFYRFEEISVKMGDSTVSLGNEWDSFITITEQATITPVFESRNVDPDPDPDPVEYYVYSTIDKYWFFEGDSIEDQLYVEDGDGNRVSATNFKFDESPDADFYPSKEMVEEYFSLTPDGKISSKKPLIEEDFDFSVQCDINGKTYTIEDEREGYYSGYVYYESGIIVRFYYDWYKPRKDSNSVRSNWSDSERLNAPAKFGTFSGAYNMMKMYGGYSFDGWYDYKMMNNKVGDDVLIDAPRPVLARFKKSDGSFYDPSGNGPVTPTPTPTPSGKSGGRSGSSYNAYTMHGSWQMTELGWKFCQDGGAYPQNQWGFINGAYYYFGTEGIMMTGWVIVNNNWYYLNPSAGSVQGSMMTGWVADPSYNGWFYLNASGAMMTDWQQIDGKWYYLNPASDGRRGIRLSNQWVGDYFVDENGVRVEGMKK